VDRPTSLYLDLLRPVAALVVLLSHLSFPAISGGRLKAFASAGTQAVDVFFVLSGFVIAHVCATRERDARTYLVSRAARLYSVAIPALVLTAVLDGIGMRINPEPYRGAVQAFSPGLLARCLAFLGEQWGAHRFPGSNGAYWSLGFEVWYYAAFASFLYAPRRWRWLAPTAVLAFIGPKVAVMFPAWLLGVATYRVCAAPRLPRSAGWALLVLPLAALAGYETMPHSPLQPFQALSLAKDRIMSTVDDYFLAALFAAHLIGFVTVSDTFAPWLERHARPIRWVAGATFSIYLAHLPLLYFLSALSPWPKGSLATLALLLTLTPLLCLAFAEISERRKAAWHALIRNAVARLATPKGRMDDR
jgi:peptidoglycan/LPS O-acetylase OafA/YrhL